MITLGGHYGGPELHNSPIQKLVRAAMNAAIDARRPWVDGSVPSVNVVFYVPGTLTGVDRDCIQVTRFSRKGKMALVAVPVPKHIAEGGGNVAFIVDSLRKANEIAATEFARKSKELFDLVKAEAIVKEVESKLTQLDREGRFAKSASQE